MNISPAQIYYNEKLCSRTLSVKYWTPFAILCSLSVIGRPVSDVIIKTSWCYVAWRDLGFAPIFSFYRGPAATEFKYEVNMKARQLLFFKLKAKQTVSSTRCGPALTYLKMRSK
jgi:hypothetical protein